MNIKSLHPLISSANPEVALLVQKSIYSDDKILEFYDQTDTLFRAFIDNFPTIAYQAHVLTYSSDALVALLHKFKKDFNKYSFGGPDNHAETTALFFESAKVTNLALAVAIRAEKRTSSDLEDCFTSLCGDPFQVVSTISKRFSWIFPDINRWRIIRNSEYHHSTVMDSDKKISTFKSNDTNISMGYTELQSFGQHSATGSQLVCHAQFIYFHFRGLVAFWKKYMADFDKLDSRDRLRKIEQLCPSKEDIIISAAMKYLARKNIAKKLDMNKYDP